MELLKIIPGKRPSIKLNKRQKLCNTAVALSTEEKKSIKYQSGSRAFWKRKWLSIIGILGLFV